MNLRFTIYDLRFTIGRKSAASSASNRQSSIVNHKFQSGFTMIEIAICLAIIGIALVAIVGVLPLGMNVQRENREGTIINQDATVFIEAIRNGSRGLNDLTNYVYAITNYWGEYNNVNGNLITSGVNGYSGYPNPTTTIQSGYITITPSGSFTVPARTLSNGTNIIGLLTTPEFTDVNGAPINNLAAGNYYSNHIVAYVRSISGPAVEKPPQDNQILQEDAFSYRLFCVNAPVATDTNIFNTLIYPNGPPAYSQQLAANLHELRLTFLWPQQPNGSLGAGRQTFRALVAGQVVTNAIYGPLLYYYQPQSFAITP
jgi:prepilin-type N-terminal cleavage/methylation domain-containing protein